MRILFFSLFIMLIGCDKIIKKAPNEEVIYQKRIKEIDFTTITSYPAMENCDSIMDKESRGMCFFKTLNDTLENRFKKEKINTKKDSILFNITISNKGVITLEESDTLKIINLEELNKIITSFPKIEPAEKHGIFVNSSFQMKVKVR